MEKISIIVPVYNSEKHIEKTLKSIIEQTYSNIEIIVINDGSTDATFEVLQKIASLDKRIVLINKTANEGVSAARNAGINVARGEYLAFVDADDIIKKNMYEKMLINIKKYKSEINFCKLIDKDKEEQERKEKKLQADLHEGQQAIRNNIIAWMLPGTRKEDNIMGSVCRSLFSLNFIKKHNILFTNIKMKEDLIFMLTCLFEASNVSVIEEFLYVYNANLESSSRAYVFNLYEDVQKYENLLINLLQKNNFFTKDIKNDIFFNSYEGLVKNEMRLLNQDFTQKIKHIRNTYITSEKFDTQQLTSKIQKKTGKNKLIYLLLNYKQYRLLKILSKINNFKNNFIRKKC